MLVFANLVNNMTVGVLILVICCIIGVCAFMCEGNAFSNINCTCCETAAGDGRGTGYGSSSYYNSEFGHIQFNESMRQSVKNIKIEGDD